MTHPLALNGEIRGGYGEFLVARQISSEKHDGEISEDIYVKIYSIFQSYSPLALVERAKKEGISPSTLMESRLDMIQNEVSAISEDLRVIFIPRTLYEMIVVRKMIEEDVADGGPCLDCVSPRNKDGTRAYDNGIPHRNDCWHLDVWADSIDHPKVVELSRRVNREAIDALFPKESADLSLTEGTVKDAFKRECGFFKGHFDSQWRYAVGSYKTPSSSFGYEGGTVLKTLSIYTPEHFSLLEKALAVECAANRKVLLYRGGRLEEDTALSRNGGSHSVSLGTGPLAGCVNDVDGTPWYYMRNPKLDPYIIPVDIDEVENSPFAMTNTNALYDIHQSGESFHPRTVGSKNHPLSGINTGIMRGHKNYPLRDKWLVAETPQQIAAKFDASKKKAIILDAGTERQAARLQERSYFTKVFQILSFAASLCALIAQLFFGMLRNLISGRSEN